MFESNLVSSFGIGYFFTLALSIIQAVALIVLIVVAIRVLLQVSKVLTIYLREHQTSPGRDTTPPDRQ